MEKEYILNSYKKTMENEYILNSFKKNIEIHFAKQRYDLVLKDFKTIFEFEGFKTKHKFFSIARSSFNCLKNKEGFEKYEYYWESLSFPLMTYATYIADALYRKSFTKDELISQFSVLIHQLFNDDSICKNFIDSFSTLAEARFGSDSVNIESRINDNDKTHGFYLICSGMGWSGSGAIVDYLREFSNIQPIFGEVGIFEEAMGFSYFVRNINDPEKILKHSIDFFFINLIGCYEIKNLSYYKPLRSARTLLAKSTNITIFSNQVKRIAFVLSSIITESNNSNYNINNVLSLLRTLSEKILELITLDISSSKIPLIDNCIHIQNISLINYLKDVKIICSNRDPRSIYISQILENSGFIKNPDDFILNQRRLRQKIDFLKNNLSTEYLENIYFVNFEDFVLNKESRELLLGKLKIDIANWNTPEKFFKPNESAKNVRNFCECQVEKIKYDIRLIADELKEYCLDIE